MSSRKAPNWKFVPLWAALWGLTWCGSAATAIAGDEATDHPIEVRIGLGNTMHVGRWTPVTVNTSGLSFDAERVTLEATDPDGRVVEFPLKSQGDQRFAGLFQSGRLAAPLRVRIASAAETDGGPQHLVETIPVFTGDDPAESGLRTYRHSSRLWLRIGAQPGFELAAKQLNAADDRAGAEPSVVTVPVPPEELPDTAAAFDAVSVIIADPVTLSETQDEAIRRWVANGGRLIVQVGGHAADWSTSRFANWSPIRVQGTYRERQISALNGEVAALVPNSARIITLDEPTLSRLVVDDGRVVIAGPTAPVIAEAPYGLGTVVLIAVPLDAAPYFTFASETSNAAATSGADQGSPRARYWDGLPRLCQDLAGAAVGVSGGTRGASRLQLSPTGVNDLQSQLAAILDHYPQISRPSMWNVIGLMAAYLLIIGPLDYLLVHRVLKKPQLTWITLPVWVLLASWWAGTSVASDSVTTTQSNTLELVDIAVDTGTIRHRGWHSLYSPTTRRYSAEFVPSVLGLPAESAAATTLPGWLPRPEEGFRGMYRRGGLQLGGVGYELDAGAESASAQGLPIDQWSTTAIEVDASANYSTTDERPLAQATAVYDTHGNLRELKLTHQLPSALQDWFAVLDVQARFPRPSATEFQSLPPGVTCDLQKHGARNLLKSYLQGEITREERRKVGSDVYISSDAYDPLSRDPDRMVRVLSFFSAAGGTEFTRLANETLTRLDLTPLLRLDRMVVFGRIEHPLSKLTIDGTAVEPTRRWSYVRLVMPVERETRHFDTVIDPGHDE
ncbi:MAG: hypothetical protein R3B90_02735 [Planctomycetaceae bacterium]